jgi:hypothetical protein
MKRTRQTRQGVTTVRANQPPKWPTKWTFTVLHCSMWDKKIVYANELEALAAMKNLWGHTVTIHRQSDKILYWLTWAQRQRMSKLKYQTIWHFCLIWCVARHEHCCKRDPSNSLQKQEQCSISQKHTNPAHMMSTDDALQQSKLTSNKSGASSVPKCFCPSDSHTHHKGWKWLFHGESAARLTPRWGDHWPNRNDSQCGHSLRFRPTLCAHMQGEQTPPWPTCMPDLELCSCHGWASKSGGLWPPQILHGFRDWSPDGFRNIAGLRSGTCLRRRVSTWSSTSSEAKYNKREMRCRVFRRESMITEPKNSCKSNNAMKWKFLKYHDDNSDQLRIVCKALSYDKATTNPLV